MRRRGRRRRKRRRRSAKIILGFYLASMCMRSIASNLQSLR